MARAHLLLAVPFAGFAPALGTATITAEVWNGSSWSSHASAFPGSTMYIRFSISTDNVNAGALNLANFQPMVTGWNPRDSVNLGLTSGGSSGNAAGGVDSDFADGSGYGRVAAFAFANILSANALKAHVSPGTMRIALTPTTNAPGTGTAANNVNGLGGVPLSQQVGGPGRVTGSPAIVTGNSVVVYGIAVQLSNTRSFGESLNVNPIAFGTLGSVRWFTAAEVASGSLTSSISDGVPSSLAGARIDVIPTPNALALIGLGGVVAGRRRR